MIKAQHPPGMLQRIEQTTHPRRRDRQRPARRTGIQTQIQHALPRSKPLPPGRLQQLHLCIVMSRADVLDISRPPAR
jgi:hypothetical protein